MSTTPLPFADDSWMLARAYHTSALDGFDPSELPHPYPHLIAAVLGAGRDHVEAVLNAELDRLPGKMGNAIALGMRMADYRAPRAVPRSRGRLRTAAQLLQATLPPHRWLVDGLLVRPGLTLLGGQPKVGKSWLGLQFARAVALGTGVLERPASTPASVLYYALEDGPSRLQARLRTAGWDATENVGFLFGDAIPPLDNGGLSALAADISLRKPALVVLDSLAAAKSSNLAENDSGQVAELMYGLSRLCATHDLSMLVVHHHRKDTTGSPLADLRGSGALGGAADTILALYRERNAPESRLGLDSRDAVGGDWTLEFSGSAWRLVGESALVASAKDERAIVRALAPFGPSGASLNELTDVVSLRREDVLTALGTLVASGQALREDQPVTTKAGRPRKIYRLSELNSGAGPTP